MKMVITRGYYDNPNFHYNIIILCKNISYYRNAHKKGHFGEKSSYSIGLFGDNGG